MTTNDQRKLATQKDYSKICRMYADDFGTDRDHFDYIDQAIKLIKERELDLLPVIDLGCGSGVVTDYLVEQGLQNIIAVDLTPEFCKMIEAKHSYKVKVICGDMVETVRNQKPSSVASYFASFSIIHIPDEELDGLLANISQSLAFGGSFVMSCHKGTFKGMEQEPYQTQKDSRLTEKEELSAYMNYFTEEELTNRISKAGMKIIRLETFEAKIVPGEFPVPKIWLLAEK
jgi:SAM-dependent methyltransferase